jgi:hypothetical protein
MADRKYLWTFNDFEKNLSTEISKSVNSLLPSVGPAPALKPEYTNDSVFSLISQFGSRGSIDTQAYTVNVVKDFKWTVSPQNAVSVEDVPELHLRENTIEYNPFINQLINNISSAGQDLANNIQKGKEQGKEFMKAIKQYKSNLDDRMAAGKTSIAGEAVNAGMEGMNIARNLVNTTLGKRRKFKVPLGESGPGKEFDTMNPYHNLYTTRFTGWKYKLPWFNNSFRQVTNSFSAGGGGLNQVIGGNLMMGLAQSFSKTFNVIEPGVYVEQPKFFDFKGQGSTYTVSFPLINTQNYEDVIRNWQLIFLLIYQNMPNRITRSLIAPPVIYEALVPGTWYSKYTYISNIAIDYIGSTRKMQVTLPSLTRNAFDDFKLGHTDLNTVIPDAYNVTISFTELFPEAQNHMYSALTRRNLNKKVRAGEIDGHDLTHYTNKAFEKGQDLSDKLLNRLENTHEGQSGTFSRAGIDNIANKHREKASNIREIRDNIRSFTD